MMTRADVAGAIGFVFMEIFVRSSHSAIIARFLKGMVRVMNRKPNTGPVLSHAKDKDRGTSHGIEESG